MSSIKEKKNRPFKDNQTGYHRSAVNILAEWVTGVKEQPFCIEGSIAFVPDVTCFKDGILDCIYEVVHSHPLDGKKLGMMQYYCYRNLTELTVHEISTDYILKQTEKPGRIESIESYIIDPFEYEDIQNELVKPII